MSDYGTELSFLHSMRKRTYLKKALTEGLMFTDHMVRFSLSEDAFHFLDMLNEVEPLIEARASQLGIDWGTVAKEHKNAVYLGMGAVAGKMPMLCFTEVLSERELFTHHMLFGAYGIVVSQRWLEANGGDRVVYTGENSKLTKSLHRAMVQLRLGAMFVDNGRILFDGMVEPTILDLLQHVQVRKNLKEFEWRIPGAHGFLGGPRATNTCLKIEVNDIESVLVQKKTTFLILKKSSKNWLSNRTQRKYPWSSVNPRH